MLLSRTNSKICSQRREKSGGRSQGRGVGGCYRACSSCDLPGQAVALARTASQHRGELTRSGSCLSVAGSGSGRRRRSATRFMVSSDLASSRSLVALSAPRRRASLGATHPALRPRLSVAPPANLVQEGYRGHCFSGRACLFSPCKACLDGARAWGTGIAARRHG